MSQGKDCSFSKVTMNEGKTNMTGFTILNQALQQPGITHSVQNIRPAGAISQQAVSGFPVNVPLHMSSLLAQQQQQMNSSTSAVETKIMQIPVSGQHANTKLAEEHTEQSIKTVILGDTSKSVISQDSTRKAPLQIKIQGTKPIQSGRPLQIGNTSNSAQQVPASANNVQVMGSIPVTTSSTKASPHYIYIQTPTGLKPVPATDVVPTNNARLPVSSGGVQFCPSSKPTTVKSRTCTLSGNLSQSIIIQKPKTTLQNLVPVSVTPNTTGKHTFAAYVSAIKKPSSFVKPQESQKVIVTPMSGPKSQNKVIFPPMNSKGPFINFQISNGQLQNDAQGNVTVMQDSMSTNNSSGLPPLQPITSVDSMSNQSNMSNIIIETQNENSFTTSIPGSRAELIGEQEYALSIPDNSSIVDNIITVSISDEIEENQETSYTINIPEKNDNLMDTECSQVLGSNLPSILRRSNSEESEIDLKKSILNANDQNANDIENKIEKAKKKLFNKSYSILNKPIADKEENSHVQSLYCEEKLEQEQELKVSVVETVQSGLKSNDKVAITPAVPQINKDRRKSRVSSDLYLQCDPIIVDKESFDEDSLGLQWHNDVALLKGSYLQFHTNEFGLIDVVHSTNDTKSSLPLYNTPLKHRLARDGTKKPTSPEDLYCCDGCGCHGMAAEFITPNFCSHTCQKNVNKDNGKDRGVTDLKKRRKARKSLLVKPGIVDLDMVHGCDKSVQREKNLVDSLSCDVTVKIIPQETIDPKNSSKLSKWKHENGFIWCVYLDYCRAKSAPEKLFRISPNYKHGFKVGMKIEAMDPVHQSLFTVVTVNEVQGYRLKLHFDSFHENYDFWINADSLDIFPPGWCEKNGRKLIPPKGYTQSTFSWAQYVKQAKAMLAPRALFAHLAVSNVSSSGFKPGMKLEAEDRKNSLTCVATVADVMDNRILIHFDSWDDIYDYWVHPNSPYIHPVGWCDKHGYSLTPPNTFKDPEHFTWDTYLKETKSQPVPTRAFRPRLPHNFTVGMKLEAVDKRVPFLIRVATVSDANYYQIRISFDGLPDELSFWVDDDSPDIYPVGWCLKTGHPLEPPLTQEEMSIPGPCGVKGCQGLGNALGAKEKTHKTIAECPYRLPPKSPEIPDRLASMLPPPLHSEPRTKEPKRGQRGRPPKVRHAENELKQETASDDDSNSGSSKRRRVVSPMSQETVERSVFEPGYTPNPNWNAPPTWGLASHCMPLDDILQRLSLRTDPRNWSQTDVQEFVENIAKSREVSWRFCKQRIDGESFLMLAQEDLVSVLGMRLGPAIKIYNSIIQLRKKIVV